MISFSLAHQQFIANLKGKSRATATILAYGKDIAQLIDHLKKAGKDDASVVSTEDLHSFMDKLSKENYTAKSISRKTNSTKSFFKFLQTTGVISGDPANA